MSNKTRIFVTGASSELMLGVISRIDKSKFEVFGLTRNTSNKFNEDINWIEGDILEPNSYIKVVSDCQIILHAAAITHSKKEQQYTQVNCRGTELLLNSTNENANFVLISSRVAGEKSGAYGRSKLQAETTVKKRCENWLIIRPSEIYGGSKAEGIEKTIQSALSGGFQLCPIGEKSKMYPIHISDASEIMYNTIFEEKRRNEVVYVNGKKGFSFKELLKMIETISGSKMIILPIPKWFLSLVASISKVLPFSIGFVPDQVDRLYSAKKQGVAPDGMLEIEDYVSAQIQNK